MAAKGHSPECLLQKPLKQFRGIRAESPCKIDELADRHAALAEFNHADERFPALELLADIPLREAGLLARFLQDGDHSFVALRVPVFHAWTGLDCKRPSRITGQ